MSQCTPFVLICIKDPVLETIKKGKH